MKRPMRTLLGTGHIVVGLLLLPGWLIVDLDDSWSLVPDQVPDALQLPPCTPRTCSTAVHPSTSDGSPPLAATSSRSDSILIAHRSSSVAAGGTFLRGYPGAAFRFGASRTPPSTTHDTIGSFFFGPSESSCSSRSSSTQSSAR